MPETIEVNATAEKQVAEHKAAVEKLVKESKPNELAEIILTQKKMLEIIPLNPFEDLTPRQKIALASKWAMLKQGEQDTLAEFASKGYDAATLFALYSMRADADSKIFSDNRARYIATITQWMPSINSSEKAIKDYAEKELATVGTETSASQQLTLLSAVKALLLRGKTFLPEKEEKDFRAVCRLYGYDLSAVK